MVQSLGIVLGGLNHSQKTFELVQSINNYQDNNFDTMIFTENQLPNMVVPRCAIMSIYDVWGYTGNIVATSLSTAELLLKLPTNNRKLFYVYDFEWIHNPYLYYKYSAVATELDIISRTEQHRKMFKNNFNKESIGILENFKIGELWNIINTKNS